MANSTKNTANQRDVHKAGAFDVRTFIALLLGIYGVVLVVMGLVGTSDAELAKDAGMNVNLFAGIGMVVVAAVFQVWAIRRPVLVPGDFDATKEHHGEQPDEERPAVR
jgi:uncharacterized membrane protein YidH (DUF202 family)